MHKKIMLILFLGLVIFGITGCTDNVDNSALNESWQKEKESASLTFKINKGEYGEYGKDVTYDGKNYIEYFIPLGKYKVMVLPETTANNGGLSVVSDSICKNSSGYDENCDVNDYFNKSINTSFEMEVPEGHHIMVVDNCSLEFIKMD